jgi:hypothetical protein
MPPEPLNCFDGDPRKNSKNLRTVWLSLLSVFIMIKISIGYCIQL